MKRPAFTLFEIIVVVSIMALVLCATLAVYSEKSPQEIDRERTTTQATRDCIDRHTTEIAGFVRECMSGSSWSPSYCSDAAHNTFCPQ